MAFNFSPEDIARFQAFLNQLSTSSTTPSAVQNESSSSSSTRSGDLVSNTLLSHSTTSGSALYTIFFECSLFFVLSISIVFSFISIWNSPYYSTLSFKSTRTCCTIGVAISSISSIYRNQAESSSNKYRESGKTCISQQHYSSSGLTSCSRPSSYCSAASSFASFFAESLD